MERLGGQESIDSNGEVSRAFRTLMENQYLTSCLFYVSGRKFCAIVRSFAQCQSHLHSKIGLVLSIRAERVPVEEIYAIDAITNVKAMVFTHWPKTMMHACI